ncbi:hypothetical protein E2562_037398 [Oryza meyeriana var. granulata]|uniref:Uncharacterized protein n=1 Tax=Oryza meyeriana var. granulata TaxID=110450 RepID=A0A6G1ECU3_9ORYZ|nr:hypothetical protein E2562_037398 [Oryza meyeriana var. granulata]
MEMLQQFAAATATPRCPLSLTAAQPTTTAQMEAAIATLHAKKQRLREAFDSLVLSSPIPLPFGWKDLDAHLSSLQSSVDVRFSQLQALEASRPAPPAAVVSAPAAARHGVQSSEDVEMEDVQQQGGKEEMASATATAPPSTSVSAKKMAPPSTVQFKEEPVEVSQTPLYSASGLATACASIDAPRLADPVGKCAGVGQDGFARHGATQPPPNPIPGCPVLQRQHMASARPKGSHPAVLRQKRTANAMNAGDTVLRPQQHMGKPRDAGDLLPQQRATAPNAADRIPRQRQQRVEARVGVANLTNPSLPPQQQQFTAGDCQLQKRQQQQQLVGVANPTNAGDLLLQKQQLTANAPNATERPFQNRRQEQHVAKPTPTVAGDLLPQQQQFTANAPNDGERLLQERQQPQKQLVAKPTNDPACNWPPLPLQHAANATNPVLRRQRQQQKMARPPNASNLPQPKQEDQHFMADCTNARNPQLPPCGMANPSNSGDLLTEEKYEQLMANQHSAPVSTLSVASNQSESTMTMKINNQNSDAIGSQPVAASEHQEQQRKGGVNRRATKSNSRGV